MLCRAHKFVSIATKIGFYDASVSAPLASWLSPLSTSNFVPTIPNFPHTYCMAGDFSCLSRDIIYVSHLPFWQYRQRSGGAIYFFGANYDFRYSHRSAACHSAIDSSKVCCGFTLRFYREQGCPQSGLRG